MIVIPDVNSILKSKITGKQSEKHKKLATYWKPKE